MIRIGNTPKEKLHNFWNNCHFHPTDAIEDPWGKRLLDRFSADGAIRTVRVYAMLEDIVYRDQNGQLCYDFRLTDLRMDYLLAQGFDILLSYNFMPECIASDQSATSTVCKSSTRYKGKRINTSPPTDYALWEEVCFQYTAHLVERYGIDTVSKWYLQCWNEPDLWLFFMATVDKSRTDLRLQEYCKLYHAFARGLCRVSEKLRIGGMGLAESHEFLEGFLNYVKQNHLKLDYISLHSYGPTPRQLNQKTHQLDVENHVRIHRDFLEIIRRCGYSDRELVYDEWGAAAHGFADKDTAPEVLFRETEIYSAYYTKLICRMSAETPQISKMLICLSGQHEMTEDFSGFRNFFTLNHIAKPIYNAYCLASRLKDTRVEVSGEPENVSAIATRDDSGNQAVLLTYCSKHFEETLPDITHQLCFDGDITGKRVQLWCIDKTHTNPYRLWQRTGASVEQLREEGTMKPIVSFTAENNDPITLSLTPNCTWFIQIDN